MLKVEITFSNPQSPEYQAAEQLKTFFEEEFTKNDKGRILIVSNAVCYGQFPKDIDLVVFGEFTSFYRKIYSRASYKKGNETIQEGFNHRLVNIKSFCLTVEVKDHRIKDIQIESQRLIVAYRDRDQRIWHDATDQSEKQKYSLNNYLKQHINWKPWTCNFIWLRNLPKEQLPEIPDNLWSSTLSLDKILRQICNQQLPFLAGWGDNKSYILSAGKIKGDSIVDDIRKAFVFFNKIEEDLGRLTREKLERITKHALLKDQRYAQSIGKRLVIIRGRPGTGKTIKLLHIAHDLSTRRGDRCLILTYNKALVSDIRRMIALARISDDIARSTMDVRTIHSYIRTILIGLGIYDPEEDEDGLYFLTNYDELKEQLLSYLLEKAITQKDIQDFMKQQHGEVAWDIILIDEGQDWPNNERDILYLLYQPRKFIIADGITQLVRTFEQTNWHAGVEHHKPIVTEKTSLRQKANLCRFGQLYAEKRSIPWDVTPREDLSVEKLSYWQMIHRLVMTVNFIIL
jgi:hypothetical protein